MRPIAILYVICAAFLISAPSHPAGLTEDTRDPPSERREVWRPAAQGSEWIDPNNPASVGPLIRCLRDKEQIVRFAALETLASMGRKAKPAVPALVKLLKHPDGSLRIRVAWTLIDLNAETDAAFQALVEALEAADPEVRAEAARAIRDIADPPGIIGSSCWGPGPRPQTPRPAIGRRAVPALKKALKDQDPAVRKAAAESLHAINALAPRKPGTR